MLRQFWVSPPPSVGSGRLSCCIGLRVSSEKRKTTSISTARSAENDVTSPTSSTSSSSTSVLGDLDDTIDKLLDLCVCVREDVPRSTTTNNDDDDDAANNDHDAAKKTSCRRRRRTTTTTTTAATMATSCRWGNGPRRVRKVTLGRRIRCHLLFYFNARSRSSFFV